MQPEPPDERLASPGRRAARVWCVVLATCLAGCRYTEKPAKHFPPDKEPTLNITTSANASFSIDPNSRGLNARTRRLTIQSAVGETVAFELRLHGQSGTVHNLSMTVGRPVLGAEVAMPAVFRLFRVHSVAVGDSPGWYVRLIGRADRPSHVPDIVVPAGAPSGGFPATLIADESLHAFAELTVPPRTAPGVYTSVVTITAGSGALVEIPLELTVLPLTLPPIEAVSMLSRVDLSHLSGEKGAAVATETTRLLSAHGVSPLLTGVYPITQMDRADEVRIDWSDFDRVVAPLMDAADNHAAPAWCRIPLDDSHALGRIDHPDADPSVDQLVTRYLRECAEHFAAQGWIERSFVEVPCVDSPGDDMIGAIRGYSGLSRRADRRLKTLTTAHLSGVPERTWQYLARADVDGWIDTWCPPARFCDPDILPAAKTCWMTADRPPYSGTTDVTGNATFARVLPWQALRYGIESVIVGSATGFPTATDGEPTRNAELLYPGAPFGLPHPVASMRLKYLRRGMQDLAYLSLLDQHGLDHVAARLADTLVPYALTDAYDHHVADVRGIGWVRNERLWDDARRVAVDTLLHRIGYAAQGGRDGVSRGVAWENFASDAGRVHLFVEGVRVRPATELGRVRVACWVVIENLTPAVINGRLAFDGLPAGWQAVKPAQEIEHIAPNGRRRALLEAETGSVERHAGGTAAMNIAFHTHDGARRSTAARLCHIVALNIENELVINGDLSDWPIGAGNVASDFLPVSGAPPPTASAARDTRCLVARDAQRLYFGIHCAMPGEEHDSGRRSNIVHYEDMVPMGEDAFEILIDPTNAGTNAPEDLFHILVRPSGVVFERGIGTDPPIGSRSAWAADARYAARRADRSWTIEMSMPLIAFEIEPHAHQIWGINFARFDSDRQEYLTWSDARYNVYNPMSLGNLAFP